jgi:hypothetical protein
MSEKLHEIMSKYGLDQDKALFVMHMTAKAAFQEWQKAKESAGENLNTTINQADEAAAEALRQDDEAHRARVLGEVKADFEAICDENSDNYYCYVNQNDIAQAILDGRIRHVTINF